MEKGPNPRKIVLVIDDNKAFVELHGTILTRAGYIVEALAAVTSYAEGELIGIGHDGRRKTINLTEQTFFLAFVDGDLGKRGMHGTEVVPYLRQHKIPCFGISSNLAENQALEKAGCFKSIPKGMVDVIMPDLQLIVEINCGDDDGHDQS